MVDYPNHRVEIFNTSFQYVGRIGETGVCNSSNDHLCTPIEVAVDVSRNIYITDAGNSRVQKFDSSYHWLMTIGGSQGNGFDQFDWAEDITIDTTGRIYVTDWSNNRVQVFDSQGAYLTTIGGSWGTNSSQFEGVSGVDVDGSGNVYVADNQNARIQVYAPGVPNWKQSNLNGFGQVGNFGVWALGTYKNTLFAGTYNFSGNGAQIWKLDPVTGWQNVMGNGFNNPANQAIDHLLEYGGKFYASTMNCANSDCSTSHGGQLWQSSNGADWVPVTQDGFGDVGNGEIFRLAVLNNQLCASTWSYATNHGAQIWCSQSGDANTWTKWVDNGLGDSNNIAFLSMLTYQSSVYVGTRNPTTGAQILRKTGVGAWAKVDISGFNDAGINTISSMEIFKQQLYAITRSTNHGNKVYRCTVCDGTDWQEVEPVSFTDINNSWDPGLISTNGKLYAVLGNSAKGMEVWQTADGVNWVPIATGGFGDANNNGAYWSNSLVAFNNYLYIGTDNSGNGAEVWQYSTQLSVYIPMVKR